MSNARVHRERERQRERETERERLTEHRADKIDKRERDRKWEERQKYGFFFEQVRELAVRAMHGQVSANLEEGGWVTIFFFCIWEV